ncbi:hypothetical protein MAMC_00420 [Methylacidimicrobium cyclopophantes]|uniref:Uncharacterized protein n=1 Tax=Methylacidimicrobium cyclopophantes TaxID=1041766 RepID=A0A5E6MBK0_9BACT|nr:hypothetical protein [Methylacidimicrobium cyclopophantes]VVM05135.1 hypothetical protein MAMC_00420 [Methylacidimicrobium cyclopophantes]
MTPVELQMQISRQIVEGEFVRPLPWFVAAAMAFALCLWGARLFVRLPAVGALPAIGALFGGTVLVSVVTFFFVGLTLPLCTLFLATLGAVICGIAVRLWNFSPLQPPTPTERPTVVVEVATTASPSPPASPARAVPLGTNPARSPSVPPDEEVPLSPSLARLQGALRRLDERRRRESSSNGTNRSGSG